MDTAVRLRTRTLTVIAQDPGVTDPTAPRGRRILRAGVEIPAEILDPGPGGYRVQVVDFDVSRNTSYKPCLIDPVDDPYARSTDRQLLRDPHFHCQNAYALVMRTLARFEFALGRRVSWGYHNHHLNVLPHAFADANAFYSPDDQALLFGYFPSRHGDHTVFTCLSHDVVVHETTHALLDGLRTRYTDPSSPDQGAFHEGFADVVALLSVFSLPSIVGRVIDLAEGAGGQEPQIRREAVTLEALRRSGLLGLAEELGDELSAVRGNPLRRSVDELWPPSPRPYREDSEFLEPHRRGEILVAAMMNAFLQTWTHRLHDLGEIRVGHLSRERVVEEGAQIADTLLTLAIRALDYTPPIHLEFGDYLSAMLTSDVAVRPDDSRYDLRTRLLKSFRAYGIEPSSSSGAGDEGMWEPAPTELSYSRTHFEPMRSEPDEVFRFIWENRGALEISEQVFSRVLSVRPSVRVGPDGFILKEVVAEHVQTLNLRAGELARYGIKRPADMPRDLEIRLHGGGTLIFDEYGRLRYHIHNDVLHPKRQSKRIQYLWENGFYRKDSAALREFSNLHRQRAAGLTLVPTQEEW